MGRTLAAVGTLALAAVVLTASCAKPTPPTLTPREAKVVSADAASVQLMVRIDAKNTNAVALSANRVKGHVVLDGTVDLGDAVIASPIVLPPNASTVLEVPLTMRWADGLALARIAQKAGPVPYKMDGTVTVGGALDVDLPFHMEGSLSREEITKAALRSLPRLPAGLGLPAPPTR